MSSSTTQRSTSERNSDYFGIVVFYSSSYSLSGREGPPTGPSTTHHHRIQVRLMLFNFGAFRSNFGCLRT